MKIGIITWFKGSNYGTHLQAIALQRYLRNTGGHDVQIINFEVSAGKSIVKRSFRRRVCSRPQKYITLYSYKKFKREIEQRDQKFIKAIERNCRLTPEVKSREDYIKICNSFELLIFGSDQIWNPNWYHRFYYADYPEIKTRKISYAPSIGVNVIPDVLKNKIKRSLSTFAAVSVREEQGAELLAPLSPVVPEVVVDPTFLLGAGEWSEISTEGIIPGEDGYVLSMFLTDNMNHWRAARRFAEKNKRRHVIVPYMGFSYWQKGTVCADAGLEDLLGLIRRAGYVLTDSFHITVFSLIFGRQFYTFRRFREDRFTSQNSRVINLLKMAGIGNRLISYGTREITALDDIDYDRVNEAVQKKIQKSKHFLEDAVERV